ncbi:MAG: polyprenol monophosphomannose synthase [Candidatus Cloacimonetes bacterium]|nr:polyprenol monophosphomannose synthase [Candidatus Cloacimonadota bacterium]MBL7087056.1 polyprenol monophosphomannose synthase [Candidatus Cloacimonadota bacterium]
MKSLAIIPTYNESENISQLIPKVLEQNNNIEILIVDDNSPDGTAEIVKEIMKSNPKVHILEREKKMGLGSAYIAGFKYAIQNKYDYIFEMDADFSHNPKKIPEFLEAIKENDLVIGSRYVTGVNVVNWPARRLMLSLFASKYVRIITRMPIKDPTAGFKCFRRKLLETIDLDNILSDGYSFQIEVNYKVWKKGFRIKELPIVFVERRSGKSKMTKKIVREAIIIVWQLILFPKYWGRRRKKLKKNNF